MWTWGGGARLRGDDKEDKEGGQLGGRTLRVSCVAGE